MPAPAFSTSIPAPFALILADATPAAATAAKQPPANPLTDALPMVAFMGVIIYFLMIRPQQKRAKEQATLMSSIKSGDRIITTGGLHGIVANARSTDDKTVLVKFAENVKIEVDKSHIVTVAKAVPDSEKAMAVKSS